MFVLVVQMEIHIPYSRSLKEKRMVRRSLLDGLRKEFGVSCAEVDRPDAHQVLDLGASAVNGDVALLERMGRDIRSYIERHADGMIASYLSECLPWSWE